MTYLRDEFLRISKAEDDLYSPDMNCDICKTPFDILGVYYYLHFDMFGDTLCGECMRGELQYLIGLIR